ncbi:Lysine-specific demethylase [Actinidia chinensis var. chinensis]|uniref:Lysine-specific demethylase n=1 Tax=Actinidia chinensis var. chinensis TaxID=1590841 RepID=A0A2R6RAX7_ACTCC|nr:Lysine-specific demethylase [Actinidia chinensis var. chinensis]
MDEEEALPDHLRCKRTDGRQWRCSRRVMEGKKLCEVHHLQGRHRQHKEKVPDSLKLQRKKPRSQIQESEPQIRARKREKEGESQEIRARKREKVGVSEALDEALRKMKLKRGDLQLELIRVFLERQVEKKKEKELRKRSERETEVMKELPYGVMEISPALSQQNLSNAGALCNVKVGFDSSCVPRRCFRSKNIEPIPISTMQILPFERNVAKLKKAKRKKCHWCRRSSYRTLIKCSTCKKEYFCTDCILERPYLIQEQVKMACPVCCRICSCRSCLANQSKENEHKDLLMNKMRVDKIQQLHYLIYMLFPVLEQINQEQNVELELEAKLKGKTVSEVQIQQAEFCTNKLHCCNNCKTSVVDFHRSCRNCEYKLCLSCAKLFRESLPRVTKAFISKPRYRSKTCRPGDKLLSKKKPISTSRKASPKWKACNDDGSIVCPPLAFGGCGEGLLDLNCVFPLSWTKELEENAKRIVCTYDLPEPSDVSLCCSLCMSMDDKASKRKLLRGAASRKDSNDNCLYFPAVQDLRDESLEHFQKHWSKGHPVIVRRVLKSTPELSWDPVVMFCTYLEKSSSRSGNDKEAVTSTNCLDWCEIEICRKQIFMGSLEGKSHANMHYEMLKLKVLLSSYLFQEQFPDHHAEIIRSLPLQDYLSGLLNLAANSLLDAAKPDLGPRLHISFGSPDNLTQADFLTKLCYNSHDVVNILMHTTDVPISTEQLTKIRNLMKTYNTHDQKMENEGEDRSSVLSDNTEESGLQDTIEKGFPLSNGVAKVSLFTGVSQNAYSSSVKDANMSHAQGYDSASDSEGSIFRSGIIRRSQELDDQNFFRDRSKSPNCSWEKSEANSSGAQWDIFRRQDVPKLLEYLSRHPNEFSHTYCSPEHVVHPILDQSFYLDAAHKIRLNEEFNIEPWTFEQHLGEAVIIPAGCPYQIRKLKSCVNVVLDFISPENASECIRLTDELHLLPVQHKARKNILEVKKMSVSSICTAVKEIDNLTGADSSIKMIEGSE